MVVHGDGGRVAAILPDADGVMEDENVTVCASGELYVMLISGYTASPCRIVDPSESWGAGSIAAASKLPVAGMYCIWKSNGGYMVSAYVT